MMVEANGEKSAADIRTEQHYSCGHSLGLQELIKLRNEAQVKALSEAGGKTCTLFKATSRPAKKPRCYQVSHAQMKNLRDDMDAITVQVSVGGQEHSIDVLRPVHGRDRLWVLYEESNLDAVITYLRDMPFGDKQTHAEMPDGVTGVIKRKNGWIVKKKQDDGSVQHILTKELDDATLLVNSDAGARDEH